MPFIGQEISVLDGSISYTANYSLDEFRRGLAPLYFYEIIRGQDNVEKFQKALGIRAEGGKVNVNYIGAEVEIAFSDERLCSDDIIRLASKFKRTNIMQYLIENKAVLGLSPDLFMSAWIYNNEQCCYTIDESILKIVAQPEIIAALKEEFTEDRLAQMLPPDMLESNLPAIMRP